MEFSDSSYEVVDRPNPIELEWAGNMLSTLSATWPFIPRNYMARYLDTIELLARKCAYLPVDDVDDLLLQVWDLMEGFHA